MRLPIPWSDYSNTRVPTDLQRSVNMYPHAARGKRQFPGITQFADMDATYDSVSFDVTNEMTFPKSMTLNSDGTKMYAYDNVVDTAYQYTLSTAWDLSTASYASKSFDASTLIDVGLNIQVANSDAKLYIMDATDETIHQYTITAGDISTAVSDAKNLDVSGQVGSLGGAFFITNDGTRLYAKESGNGRDIYSYTMSTPFDLSTASYDSKTLDLVATSTVEIWLSETAHGQYAAGEVLYVMSSAGAVIEYELSTAYDITTAVRMIQWTDGTGSAWSGAYAKTDGSKTYIFDSFTKLVYQFTNNLTFHFRPAVGATGSAVEGRGAIDMGGVLYLVQNRNLMSVDSSGQGTLLGDILDNGGANDTPVHMETDGVQLVICTGTTIYRYTVAGGLDTVIDADIEDTASTSAYIDLKFYFDQSAGNFIGSSNNDATTFSTDDKAEAESFGDDLTSVYAHNQLLYLFGETSIEPWFADGASRPPVSRQQSIERGLIGVLAVTSIDDKIYFVDQYRRPNVMAGLEYQPIYTPALAEEWDTYSTVSDCKAVTYAYRQQNFVEFTFPTQDVTWTYHEGSGQWAKREDASNNRYRALEYVNVYSKVILLDRSNAQLYQFGETTYQDDSSAITRTLDTGLITSDIYGDPALEGREMNLNSVWITFQSTGSASVDISISKDLSTFSTPRTITVASGRSTVKLTSWGKVREAIMRITTTANVGLDVLDINGDFEVLEG